MPPPPAPFCYDAFFRPTPAVACGYRDPLPGAPRCANATSTGCTIASCCTLTCGRDFHDALALNALPDKDAALRKRRERCTGGSAGSGGGSSSSSNSNVVVGGHPHWDGKACPATGCTAETCCDKSDVRCWTAFDRAGGGNKFCPAARKPRPGDTRCPPGGNPATGDRCTQDVCCESAPTCEQWFKAQPRPASPCDVYLPKDKGTVCPGASGLCDRQSCCDLTQQQCSLVRATWWRPAFACPAGMYLDGGARCREPCADAALKTACCKQGKAPAAAPAPPAIPQGSFFG